MHIIIVQILITLTCSDVGLNYSKDKDLKMKSAFTAKAFISVAI